LTEKKKLTSEEALARAQKFSEAYTNRGPYKFFPEPEIVLEVQKGLAANEVANGYRYCP
jgi:ferredoxin-thioredoxin reductase catalytic subunit